MEENLFKSFDKRILFSRRRSEEGDDGRKELRDWSN